MNISLTPEQEKLIQAQLKSGRYRNAEEVIAQALMLLEQESQHYQQWVEETRQKVADGIAQLEQGEGIDGEFAIAKLRNKLRKSGE